MEVAAPAQLVFRLARDVETLRASLPQATLDPADLGLHAHEILEDTLQFTLTGADDYGSGTGLAIPASVLERDVLPARIPGYQPRLLDELGAMGEVAWVGRGSLGRDDGRIALYRPGREILRPTGIVDGTDRPAGPRHDAIRAHLARRGASFYRELFAAAGGGSWGMRPVDARSR